MTYGKILFSTLHEINVTICDFFYVKPEDKDIKDINDPKEPNKINSQKVGHLELAISNL